MEPTIVRVEVNVKCKFGQDLPQSDNCEDLVDVTLLFFTWSLGSPAVDTLVQTSHELMHIILPWSIDIIFDKGLTFKHRATEARNILMIV